MYKTYRAFVISIIIMRIIIIIKIIHKIPKKRKKYS